MERTDFDRDLDEYLRARRKGTSFNLGEFLKNLMPKKQEKVELPQEVEVYDQKDKPAEKPKESMFAKMFKKEGPQGEELIRAKMAAEDALNDMKEVSKIALGAIKQMPDEQLRTFKQSPEFERLKIILKKHELIK